MMEILWGGEGAALMWGLLLFFVIILGISYCCYWIAFYNPVHRHDETFVIRRKDDPPDFEDRCRVMAELPFEHVFITARDGIRLSGRFYYRNDDGPIQIQFHGYRGNGIRDFCAIHSVCSEMGINTLVVDQRAHGMSGGKTMTFGILERYDCQCWVDYVNNRFGSQRKIFLGGVSMGAATVLMASNLPMPENVTGIIADCPYSTPGAIIRKVITDVKFPSALLYPFVVLGAFIYGGFIVWEESAIHAVSETTIPILLIHGSEDRFVPPQMSTAIFEKCAGKRYLEIFPGAGHGGCCATDPMRYRKILQSFMDNCN